MVKEIKRVIWSIDPFESGLPIDPATIKDISLWAEEKRIEIEPVYVFSPVTMTEMLATEKIEKQIASTLSACNILTKAPKAILNPMHTTASSVTCLLDHAEKTGAGLIMVSSHGRRGVPRMIFGSFAETLLSMSRFPILFLNQRTRLENASINKTLWATDFSKPCETAYHAFLSSSNGIAKEILLFHDVSLPIEMQTYFSRWDVGIPSIDDLWIESRFLAKDQADEWLKWAGSRGIRGDKIVNYKHDDITTDILSAARDNGAGLIVMASDASPFASVLFGSQARNVFRSGELPVWIYGPKFFQAEQQTRVAPKDKVYPSHGYRENRI